MIYKVHVNIEFYRCVHKDNKFKYVATFVENLDKKDEIIILIDM